MYEYVSDTSTRGLSCVLFVLLSLFAYATHALCIAVFSVHVILIVCMYPLRLEIYATLAYVLYQYILTVYMQTFEPR